MVQAGWLRSMMCLVWAGGLMQIKGNHTNAEVCGMHRNLRCRVAYPVWPGC